LFIRILHCIIQVPKHDKARRSVNQNRARNSLAERYFFLRGKSTGAVRGISIGCGDACGPP
jgi:hypothetical protein